MAVNPDILSALMVSPVSDEGSLPCRVLCIAHFSGRTNSDFQQYSIDPAEPEKAMSFFKTQVDLSDIFPGYEPYPIRSLNDFSPAVLLKQLPVLREALTLRELLQSELTESDDDIHRKVCVFLHRYGYREADGMALEDTPVDFLYTDLEQLLSDLLDQVLHHSAFQALEACWRQIFALCAVVRVAKSSRVELLDACHKNLEEDLTQQGYLRDSVLFDRIYSHEFGQFGGQPYNLITVDYSACRSEQDLKLMESLAKLGHAAHAAVVLPVRPQLLSFEHYEDLLGQSIGEWCSSARFLPFKHLAELEASRYLFLTMPRQVLRSPYKGRFDDLLYKESQGADGEGLLWGSAIYSLAANVIMAFEQQQAFTLMTGSEWGRERLLEPYQDPIAGMNLSPVEIDFPPSLIADLADHGIIAMSSLPEEQSSCFTQLHSLHAFVNDEASTPPDNQLPYLLTICRIAHMMKVIFREQIGTLDEPEALREKLERWLRNFVVDLEAPAEEVMMKKPFREAVVKMDQTIDGVAMSVHLVPHLRYMNQKFQLSLDLILLETSDG